MNLFTKGNRKLPKTTLIWNLPAIKTCPNSTEECRKWCYARKAERIYPQVLPFRERNLELSKRKDFVDIIINNLKKLKNWNTLRIHESGDFYSREYFENWNDIISEFPNKIFYAYTKDKMGYLNQRHKNFILIKSDDKKEYTIKRLKFLGFNGRARVDDGRKLTKNEFLCLADCKICNYCYNDKGFKQVVFKKH